MSSKPGTGRRSCIGWAVVSATAAALVLASHSAGANPALLFLDAGTGGALMPRSTQDVRIVSERLEFVESLQEAEPEYVGRDELQLPWHVRADYVLENLTAERVNLEVGFPVSGKRGEWDYGGEEGPSWGRPNIQPFERSFHVRLDGADLPHQAVRNPCPSVEEGEEGAAKGSCYSDLFTFRVAIEAHAQVALTVEYDQRPSLCCDNEGGNDEVYAWADYILETGALWAGTIGRLDIIYRFAVPPPDGVMVYDKLVGPRLAAEGPWHSQGMDGSVGGWSHRAQLVAAPEGVMDLWEPAVRFHYAFACVNDRIVLRLKATDVEPGGNISLGVQNVEFRVAALYNGRTNSYHEAEWTPCAARRALESESPEEWYSWERRHESAGGASEVPESEWTCSFVHLHPWYNSAEEHGVTTTEYRYDCCCAAAAGTGRWNPDCGKPGGAGGKGCAAGAGSVVPSPRVSPAGAGTAEADAGEDGEAGSEPDAADAEAPQDAAAESGALEVAATVADAAMKTSADATTPPSGAEAGTAVTPPAVTAPVAADASTAPVSAPPKKGCGCATAGVTESVWPCLAVFGVLLLVRPRRRRRFS